MIKSFILLGLFLSNLVSTSTTVALAAKKLTPEALAVCADTEKHVKNGDVIFISNHNYLFRRVERDTNTWTSHVGVAFRNTNNEVMVFESTWPKSKITPLCQFVGRSFEYKVAVKRYNKSLNPIQLFSMLKSATAQLNIPYDQGFDYDDNSKSFCSKYVYNVFKSVNIEIGKLETMRELLASNPNIDLTFWKAWYLGRIPYDQVTVTPASEYLDTKFTTVFSHNVVN